jgi:sarcosine oxidase gamma subunit
MRAERGTIDKKATARSNGREAIADQSSRRTSIEVYAS